MLLARRGRALTAAAAAAARAGAAATAPAAGRAASGGAASCSAAQGHVRAVACGRGFAAQAAEAADDGDDGAGDDRGAGGVRYVDDVPPGSRRTGVPAVKVGMTQAWDAHGRRVPLTVLWVDAAAVTQVKRAAAGDATTALQISAGAVKPKNAHGRQAGHCAKAGLGRTARVAAEFRVTPDAALPLGHPLTAAHFAPGQFVDVAGTTLGKGFQGVMKRWGFAGQPASHGASRSHRSAGGIGACQDPGRVWKGKKMAGRMGGAARTVQSLRVAKIDADRNLVYVRGAVPGHAGGDVRVSDAVFRRRGRQPVPVPFPTSRPGAVTGVVEADPGPDPFAAAE